MRNFRFLLVVKTLIGLAAAFGIQAVAWGAAAEGAMAEAVALQSWPAQGSMKFDVMRGEDGLKLGEAHHRWQQDGARYSMELRLETTGLAGLLYSLEYTQLSKGLITPAGLQPERFDVLQSGRLPDHAIFDWANMKVAITRKGREKTDVLEVTDQDVLSVWHLAALKTPEGLPATIALVSNTRRSPATVEHLGKSRQRVDAGMFDTEHLRIRAVTGKLTIDFWVAERYHWMPVRMIMTNDKGEVMDLQLTKIDMPTQ